MLAVDTADEVELVQQLHQVYFFNLVVNNSLLAFGKLVAELPIEMTKADWVRVDVARIFDALLDELLGIPFVLEGVLVERLECIVEVFILLIVILLLLIVLSV